MVGKVARHKNARLAVFILALLMGASFRSSVAQDDGLDLVQTAEYDIGLDCPVAAALDAPGTTLWVLMNNCSQSNYSLAAYNVADGTRANVDDYADALRGLDEVYVDLFITPVGFTPAGDLSIRYNDPETYASINLVIPLASGGEPTTQTSAAYDALLAEYSAYPEFAVYSPDHTRVVATGETSLHVLDVQAETEIVEIRVEGAADRALASFSADGEHLDVILIDDPEAVDDFSSTLLIYSLPDGALLQHYSVPSSAIWVSPDEAYAAVQFFSNDIGEKSELAVLDLESGVISAASNLLEAPAPVTTCLNSGNDVSDIGYLTSGYLSLASLHWLPDSSGVALSLSSTGEGAQGSGSVCIFNYSRLRTYRVEGAG